MQGDRLGAAEECQVDAAILAQPLRADLLPEAWIGPPAVRHLRALLRPRVQPVRLRTLRRNWIHVVLGGHGHDRPTGCWSGPAGAWLDSLPLPSVSREVINDDLVLIDALQIPIDRLDWEVHQRARSGPRVKVLAQLRGVGPVIALVTLAEIGDASRFGSARKLGGLGRAHPDRPRFRTAPSGTATSLHNGHLAGLRAVRGRP